MDKRSVVLKEEIIVTSEAHIIISSVYVLIAFVILMPALILVVKIHKLLKFTDIPMFMSAVAIFLSLVFLSIY